MRAGAAWLAAPAVLLAIVGAVMLFVYRAASPSAEERARAVLTQHLRDPDSLQLRNVRRVENGGFCGEMNAKNAFGGYTGFTRFYLVGSFVAVEGEVADPSVIAERCR